MNTKILIRSGKEPWVAISPEATLEANVLGTNSGNALFSTALFSALSIEGQELRSDYFQIDRVDHTAQVAEAVSEEFDHLVIPLANAFRRSFLPCLERWSAVIERLSIPVTVVGIGAQMAMDDDGKPADERVSQAATRFMKAVLDRGASVGVRGERTAEYLAGLGFGDSVVDIIGCPSLYRPDLTVRMHKREDVLGPEGHVVLALTPGLANAPQLSTRLGEWIQANLDERDSIEYVAQENRDLQHLLWGSGLSRDSRSDLPRHPDHPLLTLGRTTMFVDESSWRSHLSRADFVVGNRIHGVVAGVLAGVPSMALPFDSRISELSEFHRLPHRPLKLITTRDTAASLYEEVDVGPFNAQHDANEAGYRVFLERNGLKHAFKQDPSSSGFSERMASFTPPDGVVTVTGSCEVPPVVERLDFLRKMVSGPAKASVALHYPSWTRPAPKPDRLLTDFERRLIDWEAGTRVELQQYRTRIPASIRRRLAPVARRLRRS